MSAFDYPLEPLALSYLNFGFLTSSVNCVWTWVAVLTTTAAVSVLAAIRASSSPPRGNSPDEPPSSELYQSPAAPGAILKKWPNPSTEPDPVHSSIKSSSPSAAAASMLSLDTVERTNGKFSLYYNQKVDDVYGDDEDDVKINGCDCDSEGDDGEVLHWVGATLKMKMEGIGLYQCQDLRVLDGSVVRLWDGCRRRNPVSSVVTCGGAGVVTW